MEVNNSMISIQGILKRTVASCFVVIKIMLKIRDALLDCPKLCKAST